MGDHRRRRRRGQSILLGLGLEPVISYTKECESIRFARGDHRVSATIVRVPEIDGIFIEVEVVVPDGADTAAAEAVVRSVLDDLGLGDQNLEWSFYGDLVRQARMAGSEPDHDLLAQLGNQRADRLHS